MCRDLARLAALAADIADRDQVPGQAGAIRRYITALLAEIRAHHQGEDEILWPVLAAVAGQSVDLAPLSDDHQAILSASARVDQVLASLVPAPGIYAVALPGLLVVLHDVLEEHIADEEARLFPAMRTYLTAQAWRWCEKQVMRMAAPPGPSFTIPWLARHAADAELRALLAAGGWRARVVLAVSGPGYGRLERRAFGTSRDQLALPQGPGHKTQDEQDRQEPRLPGGAMDIATAPVTSQGSTVSPGRTAQAHSGPAVRISHLSKAYGARTVVNDVSFSVAEGEIFGILGPNGAGKTTTVECATGLREPGGGTIRMFGLDPRADRDKVREIVGVQLQESAFPDKLRVGEILDMYRSFYRGPADVTEVVEALGLAGKRRSYYRSLSGGQRQRLSVALALIGRPRIAVLDEMSAGLDPQARRDAWELIDHVRDRGTTVLLVTHFMEEAERLCDRVALIDAGRIVALDTPAALAARATGAHNVRFLPSSPFDESLLARLPGVTAIEHDGRHVVVTGTGELATAVIVALHAAGIEAHDVRTGASTLEDAFVLLTGRHLHETVEGEQP